MSGSTTGVCLGEFASRCGGSKRDFAGVSQQILENERSADHGLFHLPFLDLT